MECQSTITEGLGQFDDDTCELGKACCGEIHAAQWVLPMSIKTGGNKHQLWVKTISGRSHYLAENGFIRLVACRRWQRHIYSCTETCSFTTLIRKACSGIERRLVYRKIEYTSVFVKHFLSSVPV